MPHHRTLAVRSRPGGRHGAADGTLAGPPWTPPPRFVRVVVDQLRRRADDDRLPPVAAGDGLAGRPAGGRAGRQRLDRRRRRAGARRAARASGSSSRWPTPASPAAATSASARPAASTSWPSSTTTPPSIPAGSGPLVDRTRRPTDDRRGVPEDPVRGPLRRGRGRGPGRRAGSVRDPRTLGVRFTAARFDGERDDARLAFDEGFFLAEAARSRAAARSSPGGRGAAAGSASASSTATSPTRLSLRLARAAGPRDGHAADRQGGDRRRPSVPTRRGSTSRLDRRRLRRHQQRRVEPVPARVRRRSRASSSATRASTTSRPRCSPGAAAPCCCRSAYLDDVGLFDEDLFLYYEDTDLSWRGRLRGWRYVYEPASLVRHRHAASSGVGSKVFRYYTERNRPLMLVEERAGSAWPRARARRRSADARRRLRRDLVLRPLTPAHAVPRRGRRTSGGCSRGYLRLLAGDARRRVGRTGRASPRALDPVVDADEGDRTVTAPAARRGVRPVLVDVRRRRAGRRRRSPRRSPPATTSRCSAPSRSTSSGAASAWASTVCDARSARVVRRHRRVTTASADYDLFVNGTYLSRAVNRSPRRLVLRALPAASRRRGGDRLRHRFGRGRRQGAVASRRGCPTGSATSGPGSIGASMRTAPPGHVPSLPRQLPVHGRVGQAAVGRRRRGALPSGATRVEPGDKLPLILNVGRFFDPALRPQQEAARADRDLQPVGDRRLAAGARRRVRRAEPGLRACCPASGGRAGPSTSTSTPRASCRATARRGVDLLARRRFGEDAQRHPHRFEHFGITVVEAMAAGAVPIVFAAAGRPRSWSMASTASTGVPEELIGHTRRLIADPALMTPSRRRRPRPGRRLLGGPVQLVDPMPRCRGGRGPGEARVDDTASAVIAARWQQPPLTHLVERRCRGVPFRRRGVIAMPSSSTSGQSTPIAGSNVSMACSRSGVYGVEQGRPASTRPRVP